MKALVDWMNLHPLLTLGVAVFVYSVVGAAYAMMRHEEWKDDESEDKWRLL